MKTLMVVLLLCCPLFAQDSGTVRAVEGARLLHSTMRDPDSFKIGRVWIMSVEKFGDVAICYEFYSRNGLGGMNASHADYAPHSHKDIVKGKYVLNTYDNDERFEDFRFRCGDKAIKHGYLSRDVTNDVLEALNRAE